MSDADVVEAYRQVYAALRVLERHGERCVLLRRERLEGCADDFDTVAERCGRLGGEALGAGGGPVRAVAHARYQGKASAFLHGGSVVRMLLREADEEAERYGC